VRCANPDTTGGRRSRRAFLLLTLCLAAASPAAGVTPAAEDYRGRIGVVPVRAETRLAQEAHGGWRYESVVRARGWAAWKKGAVEESSRFVLDEGGLRPQAYAKRDGLSDRDRDVEIRFAAGEIAATYRGETLRHEIADPVYDLLSLRLALSLDLAAGALAQRYRVVDGRGELRPVEVERAGLETVATGLGELPAVRLEYLTRSDRRYLLWFAPALDHALVRIEQHRDGRLRAWLVLESRDPLAVDDPQAGSRPGP
jgi:hypothetical protein